MKIKIINSVRGKDSVTATTAKKISSKITNKSLLDYVDDGQYIILLSSEKSGIVSDKDKGIIGYDEKDKAFEAMNNFCEEMRKIIDDDFWDILRKYINLGVYLVKKGLTKDGETINKLILVG